MAYIVAEPCVNCKHTSCASVCPVDAFREGPNFLAIDPFECIDCDACVPECPVEAIFPEDELPLEWDHYIDLNDELSEAWADHFINETKDPLPEADEWAEKEDKEEYLVKSGDFISIVSLYNRFKNDCKLYKRGLYNLTLHLIKRINQI